MIEIPDCVWKCPKCGKEERGILSDTSFRLCPDCKGEMEQIPVIHREPFPKGPERRY